MQVTLPENSEATGPNRANRARGATRAEGARGATRAERARGATRAERAEGAREVLHHRMHSSTLNQSNTSTRSQEISALPSPENIAKAALSIKNPLQEVFNYISTNYGLTRIDAMPTSLDESFQVLSEVSEVLSRLPNKEKLFLRNELSKAFTSFYSQIMNLTDEVSAKAANRMAKAIIGGTDAIARLKNAVNQNSNARVFGEMVLENLNSQVSNDHVAENITLAKKPIVTDSNILVKSLHSAA